MQRLTGLDATALQHEALPEKSLPAEQPVAEFVVDGFLAETLFFQPGGDFCFGFGGGEAGDKTGIHCDS